MTCGDDCDNILILVIFHAFLEEAAMPPSVENQFPIVRLKYRQGDLIMKEGDFGVSIYKVNKGRVQVTKEQEDTEAALAVLGPGEVFGEMVFLNKAVETRSASVRALEDVELEVWHPSRLSSEYEQMSPVLKYITDQMLKRLSRMNKLYGELNRKLELAQRRRKKEGPEAAKRRYHRKELNLDCIYRPAGAPEKVRLSGRITDMSVGGIGMEVSARNTVNFSHGMNERLLVLTKLPGGRELKLSGRIRSVKNHNTPGRMRLGMEFADLDGEAAKALRFFMMS